MSRPPAALHRRLLDLLAALDVQALNERRAFLQYVDYYHLTPRIDWSGDSLAFFGGLLPLLAGEGQSAFVQFLEHVEQSPWTGPEQRRAFAELRTSIEGLDPDQWRACFVATGPSVAVDPAELLARCRRATEQEMRTVGQKYIDRLYVTNPEIHGRFQQFLADRATCFLVVAKAGRGKTNLLCNIADMFGNDRPVIFLSGRLEPEGRYGVLRQLAARLDYGEDWLSCLEALASLADLVAPPLVLLDGINESAAPPSLMQEAIEELLVQAERRRIKICVTCRTDFWQFYRAPFWNAFVWHEEGTPQVGRVQRGIDLPLFPEDLFPEVLNRYFEYFQVRAELTGEAFERCRHPLLLRFYCEAYRGRDVGIVAEIRLYPLLKLFWERKIDQVVDVAKLKDTHAVNNLVLTVAQVMREHHQTRVPRASVAAALQSTEWQLDDAASLYARVLDEEIILEEEVDEIAGTKNVIFVYDKFSEYAIALAIFSGHNWMTKTGPDIVEDAHALMQEESVHQFATLRGTLEFLALRLEDTRGPDQIHFDLIRALLDQDWKWRRIATLLSFQLADKDSESFWQFIESLSRDPRDFVRRICAGQLGTLVGHDSDRVLTLLNVALTDHARSVREEAHDTILALDPVSAVREAELLLATGQPQDGAARLAAEALLWPLDSQSVVLQEKARRLVKEPPSQAVEQAVLAYLEDLGLPPYEDLYKLEELEEAFQVDWRRAQGPTNAYLHAIDPLVKSRKQALRTDLGHLQTWHRVVTRLHDLARESLGAPDLGPRQLFTVPLSDLTADSRAVAAFLDAIERQFGPGVAPRTTWGSIGRLALATADMTPPLPADPASSVPQRLLVSGSVGDLSRLIDLWEIAEQVYSAVARASGTDQRSLGPNTAFGEGGAGLGADEWTALRIGLAHDLGVELPHNVQRRLWTLGRFILWLWQAAARDATRELAVSQAIQELAGLSAEARRERLSSFESTTLTEGARLNLAWELQALCRLYAEAQPERLVAAVVPLIIWHDERSSLAMREAFEALFVHDPDSFWALTSVLLGQEDQRLIDAASELLEWAEFTEQRSDSDEVFEAIRGVLASELGVNAEAVTPDARFREDLDADSLDLVEVVLALEERFNIQVNDDQIAGVKTVGEAVDLVRAQAAARADSARS